MGSLKGTFWLQEGTMPTAMKLSELRKLPKKELWKLYDEKAEHVEASLNYYWDEIVRREQSKQTTVLIWLTIFMVITTVFSAIGVFVN
jgi:hypothetical protein